MADTAKSIHIGDRTIGPGARTFIIAEAGVNHNGEVSLARELIDVAAEAGADAVKFQSFKAERLVTLDAPKAQYQIEATGATQSQLEMLKALELSPEAYHDLRDRCRQRGVLFLSSPFDEESADFLDDLGIPAFKIPSGEVTNFRLLEHIASKHKPIIMSTGMCSLGEVDDAVRHIRRAGGTQLVLLHCVSAYPADPAEVNLRAMNTMATAFGLPVGFSDHTPGTEVVMAAVALGAAVIEKHFTLDRNLPGPDHRASLDPGELKALVSGVRTVESALGNGRKEPSPVEMHNAAVVRKSLVAAIDIEAGARLTEEMIRVMRPGTGLPPSMLPYLIGRTVNARVPAGGLLTHEVLV